MTFNGSYSELRGFGGQLAYQMSGDGQVELDGDPLMLKPGSEYHVKSASTFAPKSSQGDPSYGDLEPYDSPSAQANWAAGYGYLRASHTVSSDGWSGSYWAGYLEGLNVDASLPGRVILSPPMTFETLPFLDNSMTPARCVELGGTLLCAAGTALYVRNDTTAAWRALNATPFPNNATDAAVLGGTVFVALGDAQNMQYTSGPFGGTVFPTFGTTLPATYLTTDKVGLYRSFGINQVQGSTSGIGWAIEPVLTVGDSSAPITSLAPGGGLVLLWAGKQDGLWGIPSGAGGTATKYLPFERRYARNARPLMWHGPLVLVPNGRGLWTFQASSQTSGEASNITPARDSQQLGRVRGDIRALGDSARYVYAALVDTTFVPPQCYIDKMDTRNGHWHTWLYPGQGNCETMFSRATDTNLGPPSLWFGFGNHLGHVGLPMTGDDPLSDPNSLYTTSTTNVELISSSFDFNLPDAEKALLWVVLGAERLQGAIKFVNIDYQLDGDNTWRTDLSPRTSYAALSTKMFFPRTTPHCHWVQLRYQPRTFVPTDTPVIRYVVIHARVLIENRWRWTLTVSLGQNQQLANFAQREEFAFRLYRKLLRLREFQDVVVFRDREGYSWNVLLDQVDATLQRESGGVQPEYTVGMELTQALPGLAEGLNAAIQIPIPIDQAAVLSEEAYLYADTPLVVKASVWDAANSQWDTDDLWSPPE